MTLNLTNILLILILLVLIIGTFRGRF